MDSTVETTVSRATVNPRRGLGGSSLVTLIVLVVGASAPSLARAQDACTDWRARIIEAQGAVELMRGAVATWTAARVDDVLCENDSLRVGAFGRAAIVMRNNTEFRLDQYAAISFVPPDDAKRSWLNVLRGIVHIISRDPRDLNVTTPFANAGIEGTEFRVEVTESSTRVDVLEGTVELSNESGSVRIMANQTASAEQTSIGTPRPLENALESLDWTRYYPVILAGELPPPDATVPDTAAALVSRAQSRLIVGRAAEAEADIAAALMHAPTDPDALALRTIIFVAKAQVADADDSLDLALSSGPGTAPVLLAHSHVLQRGGELEEAADLLREGVEAYPDNALVWARLAELSVGIGDIDEGLAAARRANQLNPNIVLAAIVRGFAALRGGDPATAEDAFTDAIRLEPSAPLGRLGLGLALVRQGSLDTGRAEIENAVLLDAGNGLIRSYMAKAYYDERRPELAESQLAAAKRLDPTDPTAYVYDALRLQNANEPIGAHRSLALAQELNRNRPAYRSGLRLDNDLAVRSAGRGRIYRDMRFEQLALLQGWTSVAENPLDFGGHRLLADMYSTLPRHQIARVNELYQAQLLQPGSIALLEPQLGEANLHMLNSVGPSDLAHSEFSPLLSRNGARFQGSAITGGNDTRGETIVVGGTNDRVTYNFGQFHFETLGFRENNDFEQDLLTATVQYQPSERAGLLLELRSNSIEKGDLLLKFDPSNYNPSLRQLEDATSLRLGGSYRLSSKSTLIGSVTFEDATLDIEDLPSLEAQYDIENATAQVQHLLRPSTTWRITSGASARKQALDQQSRFAIPLPEPPFLLEQSFTIAENLRFVSLYSYATVDVTAALALTVGGSIDMLDGQDLERDQFNPKVGLVWSPRQGTVIRAAAFRTLNGPVISKQIIQPSLEPTQVAGFNQFYFAPEGDDTVRVGLALDHEVSAALHLGAELSQRQIESPFFLVADPMSAPQVIDQPIDESLTRAYLYWTPSPRFAISAMFEHENVDTLGEALAEEFTELTTRRLPISVNYFSPSGLSAGLTATPVNQSGMFWDRTLPPTAPPIPGEDHFWVFDLSLGYRLPNRRGLIELTARNLFDEEFQFQDTDPETPRIFPERFVGLRFTLAY